MTVKKTNKPTMTKAQQIEAARLHFEECKALLRANEILWMDAWKTAPNPFIAINEWCSQKQRAKRKPIIDSWLKAAAAWEAIKPKREPA